MIGLEFKEWLNEALSIKGNYKGSIFQRLVAAQYNLAPAIESEAIPAYRDLIRKISRQNQFLQSKFQFNPSVQIFHCEKTIQNCPVVRVIHYFPMIKM